MEKVNVSLKNGFTMTFCKEETKWKFEDEDLTIVIDCSAFAWEYIHFVIFNDLIRGIPFRLQLREAELEDRYIPMSMLEECIKRWDEPWDDNVETIEENVSGTEVTDPCCSAVDQSTI